MEFMEGLTLDNIVSTSQELQTYIQLYGLRVLGAILIFMAGRWLAKWAQRLLERALGRAKMEKTLANFLGNIAYAMMLILVIVAALNQIGIQTTSIAAVLAAAGLAIGLALQGSLSNFAAGFMIIMFKPFKAGEFVEVNGVAGSVDEVSIFHTILKTPDNKTVVVPNSKITDGNIINYSREKTRKLEMVFGVSYADDLRKVRKIIEDIIASDDRILPEPAPQIAVLALADSSVNFAVRPWVKTEDYWATYFDLNERIKNAFDDNGITIPFPQQDVYLHTVNKEQSSDKKKKKAA